MADDRVTQTIERLISNLPQVIEILKIQSKHNLARQIANDLDNLEYWQAKGGLVKKEQAEKWRKQCSQFRAQHAKDSNTIARFCVQLRGCTCVNRVGDEYYCTAHGGE